MNVEVVNPRYIKFITYEDGGDIMAKNYRIIIYRFLLKKLKVDGSI
jgi:hypothetical protein